MTSHLSARRKRTALESIYRVRIANLRSMLKVYDDSQAALARALNVSAAHVTHIIGENPVRAIGERMARDYEAKLGLPQGWLDVTRG